VIEPVRIIVDDTLRGMATIAPGSVHCCVTSPPYWGLRDYGVDGQIGLEATPQAYIERMVEVARGVRRVLRDDGTFWLNVGDSYAGSWGAQSRGPTTPGTLEGSGDVAARQISAAARLGAGTGSLKRTPGLKAKDLGMIPWRLAIALQDDGWWIRSVVVWAKKSPSPSPVKGHCRENKPIPKPNNHLYARW
jgi:DNA modification methylase